MKFEDAFKQKLILEKVPGVVERTTYVSGCCICHSPTRWTHDIPGCVFIPVCSDECRDASVENAAEVARNRDSSGSSDNTVVG